MDGFLVPKKLQPRLQKVIDKNVKLFLALQAGLSEEIKQMNKKYIIEAVRNRLAEVESEQQALEDFLFAEQNAGAVGRLAEAELTVEPIKPKSLPKVHTFQGWLRRKGIELKKGDKRYSKFYQRFRAYKKKSK